MGYINVFLSTPCSVSIKNRQLVVRGDSTHTFPIEDLNALMIESGETMVSGYALQMLANNDVVVFTCDRTHLPNGVLLPLNAYYRSLKILNCQLSISKPLKKQLWQSIVKRKIENQATCVRFATDDDANDLLMIAEEVCSNDAKNAEAVAANLYFKKLFGKNFLRREESFTNSALNYGYSLVRGVIARTLSVLGFEPSIGVHHRNELNNFNLADDLIEPYRPIVDLLVHDLCGYEELTHEVKKKLFSLMNCDVLIANEIQPLSYAVELTIRSLRKSYESNENQLVLPQLVPINMHSYE